MGKEAQRAENSDGCGRAATGIDFHGLALLRATENKSVRVLLLFRAQGTQVNTCNAPGGHPKGRTNAPIRRCGTSRERIARGSDVGAAVCATALGGGARGGSFAIARGRGQIFIATGVQDGYNWGRSSRRRVAGGFAAFGGANSTQGGLR